MSEVDRDRWLTIDEAAAYLSYSVSAVRRFAKSGQLKSARAPGHQRSYRFRYSWLDEFMLPVSPKAPVRKRRSTKVQSGNPEAAKYQLEFREKVEALRRKRQLGE